MSEGPPIEPTLFSSKYIFTRRESFLAAPQVDDFEAADMIPPKTTVMCTAGESMTDPHVLKEMLLKGMSVLRLKAGFYDHLHEQIVSDLRELMQVTRRICAIFYDTQGPEIRLSQLADGISLEVDQELDLVLDSASYEDKLDRSSVGINFPPMLDDAKPSDIIRAGQTIHISDGLIGLVVQDVSPTRIACQVTRRGVLRSRARINLPGLDEPLIPVTDADVKSLDFACKLGVDFVTMSFVRSAQDLKSFREHLNSFRGGDRIKLISKVENREGLSNFDEILELSDGIMIARGYLGAEIPIEQVSLAQKMMISKCNQAGKPVITASQMLDSMIKNPSPTRAEVSDVANAVLDGTDCVVLYRETASGTYPVKSLEMMCAICREAEASLASQEATSTHTSQRWTSGEIKQRGRGHAVSIPEAIAGAAVRTTIDVGAVLMVVLTETGTTARLVSKFRPRVPVLTVTAHESTARCSLMSYGCFPLLVGSMSGLDSLIERVVSAAKDLKLVKVGDLIVMTSGANKTQAGATNDLRIVQVEY